MCKMLKQVETKLKKHVNKLLFIYSGICFLLMVIFIIGFFQSGLISLIKTALGVLTVIFFIGMVLSFIAANELSKKHEDIVEVVEEKNFDFLMPEEKAVVELLKKNDNAMTQKEIAIELGLSKVKAHRIIKRLEQKKVVKKFDYGMTNKVKLESN